MKSDVKVTDLFLEVASEIRYNILKKLNEKNQKQSQVAKEIGMTLPESHRQFERLTKSELIIKTSEGMYSITSFGKIFLEHMESSEFLLKYKNYFNTHQIGNLPKKFVKRLSDLNESTLVEGAFVLNDKMIQIAGKGKYLRVISAHVPPDAFRQGVTSARKTGIHNLCKNNNNSKRIQKRIYKCRGK